MNGHHTGEAVTVVVDAIERPAGTVFHGTPGTIIEHVDSGYRIDFGNGLILDAVASQEITSARPATT